MAMQKLATGIIKDDEIMQGKPVIEGTRIPVYIILSKLASGMTLDEINEEYDLSIEQIRAALMFAAEILEHEDVANVA